MPVYRTTSAGWRRPEGLRSLNAPLRYTLTKPDAPRCFAPGQLQFITVGGAYMLVRYTSAIRHATPAQAGSMSPQVGVGFPPTRE